MSKKPLEKPEALREEWPRIREVTVKGIDYFQVDGRPHFKRQSFDNLADAKAQAEKWAGARARYGTAGRFIAERDATKFAEALTLLAPHKASIVDAARFYARHLDAEARKRAGKTITEALKAWTDDYDKKDRARATVREIKSMAGIFGSAFPEARLSELTPGKLTQWLERYESAPGVLASPQTRANLRTKLSQFLGYAKLQGWIESNPVELVKLDHPPRSPVTILEVAQGERLLRLGDASEERAIVLPYLAVCLLAGLRPSEAERLAWRDIHFATGDIHVRGETSKVKEERFVPMEANLLAWLESCPHRHPGPIIGKSHQKFRMAWEEVRRLAGYRIGQEPDKGWSTESQEWPSDVLRHTYGSMWLAIHKSRSELAERMGNSEAIIKTHYRRAIREDVAKAFWNILPAGSAQKIVSFPAAVSK
jgi:integrase